MPATIYFAHGMESGPWGRKITALAGVARRHGLAVESPDYSDTMDPEKRVAHLLAAEPPRGHRLILVGSSMGGYVAAVASRTLQPAGLFLMAPAFYMPGYEGEVEPGSWHTEVVHGWRDEVIPPVNSWRFARTHRARLHMLDSDHGLADTIPEICALFDLFLETTAGTHAAD